MSDACVAQLIRAIERQSKDLGWNQGTVESVSFFTETFQILLIEIKIKVYCILYMNYAA